MSIPNLIKIELWILKYYLGAEELTVDTTDCLVNSGRSSSDLWIGSSIIVPDFCLWNSESICVLVLSGCSGAPIKII